MLTIDRRPNTNDRANLFWQLPNNTAKQAPTYILYFMQVRQKAGVEHTRLLRGGRPLHPHPLPHHRHHRIGGMLAR